jgi:uncharacterized protein
MDTHFFYSSDVAFTPAVKAIQTRKGSRGALARQEDAGAWPTTITPDLAAFIAEQTSVFLATASAKGHPYIQHRGGPPGFLHVLDDKTIAFADFVGNRQYITQGNLAENPQAHLFLIDYAQRRRIKIWGTARVIEDDQALLRSLTPEGYRARIDHAIVFIVSAWDANCPQHIPQRFDSAQVAALVAERDKRIAALEGALNRLREGAAETP